MNHRILSNLTLQIFKALLKYCWLWISPWIKPSWHSALRKTNLDDSINPGNFSVRGFLPLIRKDSTTHIHGLAAYVKEGLPSVRDLSLKKLCGFLLKFLTGFSSFTILLLFPLSIIFLVFMFVFGDFNVHYTDWLT